MSIKLENELSELTKQSQQIKSESLSYKNIEQEQSKALIENDASKETK